MEILRARFEDAAVVMEIIACCKEQMRAAGSDQWNEFYPNVDVVADDAAAGSLWLLVEGGAVIGSICMNENQAPEYHALQWRHAGRVLVLHRLCILPEKQGRGAARFLMAFAERYASENGYNAIRFDTYQGNPRAVALYEGLGYERAGEVSFPRRKLRFDCFERPVLSK